VDAVLRATTIYLVLLVVFRISGRRTLAEITTFDLILLLLIGEATQQALLGNDFSVTNAILVIVTLVFLDVAISLFKFRWKRLDKVLEGVPTIIVENGKALPDRMSRARIDEDDVMEAARRLRGIDHMEQIRYAVLERSGGITVIPFERRIG